MSLIVQIKQSGGLLYAVKIFAVNVRKNMTGVWNTETWNVFNFLP